MIQDSQGKEMIDFWDYMDKKVKITLKDGKIFIGYAMILKLLKNLKKINIYFF